MKPNWIKNSFPWRKKIPIKQRSRENCRPLTLLLSGVSAPFQSVLAAPSPANPCELPRVGRPQQGARGGTKPSCGSTHTVTPRRAAWQHPGEILAVLRSAADFPFTSAGTEFCPRCLQMFRVMPQGPADHHAFTFYLSHFLLPRCPLLQPAYLPAPPALKK